MKKFDSQSGQATLELLVLLIGFVSLFLGLIFVCGLADGDIGILLSARNNAELSAAVRNANTASGPEFGNVFNGTHDIYNKDERLVFSPTDYTGRSPENTIAEFPSHFYKPEDSVLRDTHNDYKLQAEMKEWKNIRNAGNGFFKADFVSDLVNDNALSAARLVSATSGNLPSVTTVSGCKSCDFFSGFAQWFGINISDDTLKRASGNRVYMPVLSREE